MRGARSGEKTRGPLCWALLWAVLGQFSVVFRADCCPGSVHGPSRRPGCRAAVGGRVDEHKRRDKCALRSRCSPVLLYGPFLAHACASGPSHRWTPGHQQSLRPQHLMPTVCGTRSTGQRSTRRCMGSNDVPTDKVRPRHLPSGCHDWSITLEAKRKLCVCT